jgi:hypothetical protein
METVTTSLSETLASKKSDNVKLACIPPTVAAPESSIVTWALDKVVVRLTIAIAMKAKTNTARIGLFEAMLLLSAEVTAFSWIQKHRPDTLKRPE